MCLTNFPVVEEARQLSGTSLPTTQLVPRAVSPWRLDHSLRWRNGHEFPWVPFARQKVQRVNVAECRTRWPQSYGRAWCQRLSVVTWTDCQVNRIDGKNHTIFLPANIPHLVRKWKGKTTWLTWRTRDSIDGSPHNVLIQSLSLQSHLWGRAKNMSRPSKACARFLRCREG
jgi:hypothetical protein